MAGLLMASSSCFLLGVLTTVHPCPLTTNVAAISLLSGWSAKYKKLTNPFLLYVTGYIGAYIILSVLLSAGIFIRSDVSLFLQSKIRLFLGPVLILVGMIFTDMIKISNIYRGRILSKISSREWGGTYALPMGALLALSFCPATAAIFFGLLIPLSIQHDQAILFPVLYGLGASIPLIGIVVVVLKGSDRLLSQRWQKRIPVIAGWILILVGIVVSLQQLF
jgi:hypothetical protein